VIEASYEDGEVNGVDRRVAVETGDEVRIEVTSDVADRVHVHGYDLFADVGPGMPAVIEFKADIPGIFEVELEDSHGLLFELEVS
jgi:heme/copper-type cytochrome/quinol oxidase subunit 2